MKKTTSILIALILVATTLPAQEEETLFGESGLHLSGAWGGPVFGTTFFDTETVPTKGSFWGLEFNDMILIGMRKEKTFDSVKLRPEQDALYDFKHRGYYIRFFPNRKKVVHPVFGFSMGNGELEKKGNSKDNLFLVQPAIGLEINIFNWWRAEVDGGYRFVSGTGLPGIDDADLSTFFITLSLRFGWSWQ